MIQWQAQHQPLSGWPVKSPATGFVMPLTSHSDLLYNANVLSQALCIKVQHDTLLAPFSGDYSYSLAGGRRLSFKHKSGLTLQLDLSDKPFQGQGAAIRRLVDCGQTVQAGQPVVRLDLQLLRDPCGYQVVFMVLPHPAIMAVFGIERFVEAGLDTALTIKLKNK